MILNDLFAQGQPDAGPCILLQPVEALEDCKYLILVSLVKADAVI